MSESNSNPKKDSSDFLWKVLGRFDFYINTTNAKAALLVAYNSFVVSGILLKWKDISPSFAFHPTLSIISAILLFLIAIFSIISLIFTFRTTSPYLTSYGQDKSQRSKIFFKDVSKFETADNYYDAIKSSQPEYFFEDLAKQVHVLARGVDSKFSDMKKAIDSILFLQVPTLVAVLLVFLITKTIDI